MSAQPEPNPQAESDRLDAACDQAIAACGGDLRSSIRTLILANEYLEWELEQNVSGGISRPVERPEGERIEMQDIRLFIDKLHADAQACETIGQTALNEGKRKIFAALADTYRKLANEMERIAAAHAVLDEEREKNLLGVLGGGTSTADRLAEIARVLSSAAPKK